jgi:hypothetical protein
MDEGFQKEPASLHRKAALPDMSPMSNQWVKTLLESDFQTFEMPGLVWLTPSPERRHFHVDPLQTERQLAGKYVPMIVPPTWSLPAAIRIRLGQSTYGRQRAIIEDGHLLLVLHKPPGPDDRGREGVLFWRTPAGEWQCNRGGPGPGGIKRHVQTYSDLEAKLTADYERELDLNELFDLVETLTPLVRSVRNMHQALQTAREGIKQDPFLIELRDLSYEPMRNLELLSEDVRNAIQHRTAREAEAQACLTRQTLQASHRLNILAALFFPLTAVASLFGMNLTHGLDEHDVSIFWVVASISIGLGFIMKGWVLAKSAEKPKAPTKKS